MSDPSERKKKNKKNKRPRDLNKTISPLAQVGYEIIMANEARIFVRITRFSQPRAIPIG